ncbi:hypothetical protein TWF102_002290 [Orbilia oligospora]|uniref:F-box domain-containing protein n=1 Tax=Orbilia oligospora TaxID=2813651 RepID=A0A7C8JJ09_ORBOL|nr:hypothetical protein TWF103_008732 [Orbilia oligospora]KAF3105365.1 hypothetical protein TWF102_002290 [Orbilia oligospora]
MPKKIFKRALRKLHIVRSCDDESSLPTKSKTTQKIELFYSNSEFLNLPLDIFNLILTHLAYADIVSLSLTTKSLRDICPHPSSKVSPESECRCQVYQRCLPYQRDSSKSYQKSILIRGPTQGNCSPWEGKCSYCLHPLCPPTCPSALILDYRTGILYPASLYPFHLATPAPTDGFPETSGCLERFVPGDKLSKSQWNNSPIFPPDNPMYKTIWCEHHRCPESLLKDNYMKEDAPTGVYRLYGDYYADGSWETARNGPPKNSRRTQFIIPHTKFLAGYRKTPLNESPKRSSERPPSASQPSTLEPLDNVVKFYKLNLNNGIDPSFDSERDQDPIDEPYFYDTLCRHCFLPLKRPDITVLFWSKRTCECAQKRPFKSRLGEQSQNPIITKPGCSGCGIVSVKFTIIEAFTPVPAYDSHIHFSLVLASEMQIGSIRLNPGERILNSSSRRLPTSTNRPVAPHLQRRLLFLDPEKHQQSLTIIRYEPIIPLPPKTVRGLQNLPSPIINRILIYVLYNTRYRKPRYISEARRLIFHGWADWTWDNYRNAPAGTCSECRKFKSLDRETRLRSTWRCTDDCNYGFHMFMTKGSMRGH